MSNLIRCDQCKREIPSGMSWLTLERDGVRSWQDPSEWHFCSWDCIEAYAAARKAKHREMMALDAQDKPAKKRSWPRARA